MTLEDVRSFGNRVMARLRAMPLSLTLGVVTVALVVAMLAFVGLSGDRYAVLFDGLSPARGGKVIAALQKEGIAYRLSQNGNVISVPAGDLGRARLRLGVDGQPETGSSAKWTALEGASVTTSQAAADAMHQQAVEASLQESIASVSGAQKVQVMLAVPRDTPFLADQPKPKASVVLTGAPQADQALGMTVASIVAAAVPGLAEKNVVVATGKGTILYPMSGSGNIAQQLAVVKRIETAQEAKIRGLLVPVLGAGNARVSVTANVDFAARNIQSVAYGPTSVPVKKTEQSHSSSGGQPGAIGIPGALSNQPPGPTTAPLNTPATAQATSPSKNTSKQSEISYDVNTTTSTERAAPWQVKKISVSVIVNRSALGKTTLAELKSMIDSTIAVPSGQVDVTSAPFVTNGTALVGSPQAQMIRILQASLFLVAALGLLFGVILPLTRWLRERAPLLPAPPATHKTERTFEEDVKTASLRDIAGQAAEVGLVRPDAMAAVLQHWLTVEGPVVGMEDAG